MVLREHEADLVVAEKVSAAEDVAVLTLVDPDGGELPAWTPGAHVDLILGPSLVRQYSLCGRPDELGSWRVGVLRNPDSRGGSQHVHDVLQPGSTVRVRGPRNHFALVDSRRYLFIAGGIGITPILAMIRAVEATGAEWELVYGGRKRSSMAFLDELAAYSDQVRLQPQEEVGLIDLASLLGRPREDTLVYCCGPEPLLAAVEKNCEHWPAGSLHVERFAPKALPDRDGTEEPFEVVFERSGVTTTVPPGRSILDVAEEAGLPVLSSCREGTCGTCEIGVLEGEPEHLDSLLSPEEQEAGDLMMICVSRSRSPRLVLDL
jgi:ferredoxin-NADP reductase